MLLDMWDDYEGGTMKTVTRVDVEIYSELPYYVKFYRGPDLWSRGKLSGEYECTPASWERLCCALRGLAKGDTRVLKAYIDCLEMRIY